jgi:hypothetical protein
VRGATACLVLAEPPLSVSVRRHVQYPGMSGVIFSWACFFLRLV